MCHSLTVFLSLLLLLHQRKHSICCELNWTQTSFFLMLNLRVVFHFKKSLLYAAFFLLSTIFAAPSPLSYPKMFCICICKWNNSCWKGALSADLPIIHQSQFAFTISNGWVSSSNLHIPQGKTAPWLLRMTEGAFVVFRKVDSCAAFGLLSDILLVCLPSCPLWPGPAWLEF